MNIFWDLLTESDDKLLNREKMLLHANKQQHVASAWVPMPAFVVKAGFFFFSSYTHTHDSVIHKL